MLPRPSSTCSTSSSFGASGRRRAARARNVTSGTRAGPSVKRTSERTAERTAARWSRAPASSAWPRSPEVGGVVGERRAHRSRAAGSIGRPPEPDRRNPRDRDAYAARASDRRDPRGREIAVDCRGDRHSLRIRAGATIACSWMHASRLSATSPSTARMSSLDRSSPSALRSARRASRERSPARRTARARSTSTSRTSMPIVEARAARERRPRDARIRPALAHLSPARTRGARRRAHGILRSHRAESLRRCRS